MMQEDRGGFQERLETATRDTGSHEILTPSAVQIPTLTILWHPDTRRIGELVGLPELNSGQEVAVSRLGPAFALPGSSQARPLAVAHLSRQPFLLAPRGSSGTFVLKRAGARTRIVVNDEPFAESRDLETRDLEVGVVLNLGHRVVLLLHWHHPVTTPAPHFGLVGDSSAMFRLRQEIELVAGLSTPVLLRGESGTGKELVARAIHEAGERSKGPYVTVNMAAIPTALAASELFGVIKGAYTGAHRTKPGFLQRAHGGTLFLDEIGETPSDVQPLLLRALENGEIQPVGSVEAQRVDVRILTASDADLDALIAQGRFRMPLLHRLAGYELRVPPLRDRRSDFGRLLCHFLRQELTDLGETQRLETESDQRPWPPAVLVARLARQDWPGNVRQLKNAARRLALSTRTGGVVALESLLASQGSGAGLSPPSSPGLDPVPAPQAESTPPAPVRPVYRKPSEVDEEELIAALKSHRFQPKPAAMALGVSRTTLYELIEGCSRIRKAVDLQREEIEAARDRSAGDLDAAAAELEVSPQGLKRRMKSLGLR